MDGDGSLGLALSFIRLSVCLFVWPDVRKNGKAKESVHRRAHSPLYELAHCMSIANAFR
jgi:hypothetical protein